LNIKIKSYERNRKQKKKKKKKIERASRKPLGPAAVSATPQLTPSRTGISSLSLSTTSGAWLSSLSPSR
jgi:hypothetical protein